MILLFEPNTLMTYFYQTSQILTFEAYYYLLINEKTDCAHLNRNVPLTSQLRCDVRPEIGHSYRQWWSMGATLIVDATELAWYYPVLTYLPRKDGKLSWPSSANNLGVQWYHNGLPTMLMPIA